MPEINTKTCMVTDVASRLRKTGKRYLDENAADLLDAIAAERDQLAAKLVEVERERIVAEEQYLQGMQEEIQHAKNMREDRDAANAEIARLREAAAKVVEHRASLDWMGDKRASALLDAAWWRRIDGTPIPNDLLVCIAEIFGQTANANRATVSALRSAVATAREALEPFVKVPLVGDYGAPLVCANLKYEDGSWTDRSPIGHKAFDRARSALAALMKVTE
jgi:hypothetical protein